MQTRNRCTAAPLHPPPQGPAAAAKARNNPNGTHTTSLPQRAQQQRPGKSTPGTCQTRTVNSTDADLLQSSTEQQQPQQPLETLVLLAKAYFSADSDGDLVEAAHTVADLWYMQDSEVRARLSVVLEPLLEREEQLSKRAEAIAALKQARRDRAKANGGPRRSGRNRDGEPQQEPAGSNSASELCVNNGSNNSSKRQCRRTSTPTAAPLLQPTPTSPLINNQQQQPSSKAAAMSGPADLDGPCCLDGSDGNSSGSGSGTSSGDSTVCGLQDTSRDTPGVESSGDEEACKQQTLHSHGRVCGHSGVPSRRKQHWRPCHAALQ